MSSTLILFLKKFGNIAENHPCWITEIEVDETAKDFV